MSGGLRRRAAPLAAVLAALPVLAACRSSTPASGQTATKAPAQVCQQLLAVLSDGPDPSADPVGYALTQEQPLGQIHTSDHSLAETISSLISADRALVHSNGSDHMATTSIRADDADLNKACPGVSS